ncbi:MAG: hypothetical protein C0490_12830 [Marivirga sp.]|nr:hypothetical protein [Marivirga sp.]
MDKMKTAIIHLFFVVFTTGITTVTAQDSNETSIQSLIDTKRFVFQVQSVSPARGGLRQLSPGYTLVVLPDTIISELPYFGRAYQATINPSDAGIKFTSTDFQYELKNRKKGGWDIKIRPKDKGKAHQLFLTITTTGRASMRISSSDRESISYNGFVEAVKK